MSTATFVFEDGRTQTIEITNQTRWLLGSQDNINFKSFEDHVLYSNKNRLWLGLVWAWINDIYKHIGPACIPKRIRQQICAMDSPCVNPADGFVKLMQIDDKYPGFIGSWIYHSLKKIAVIGKHVNKKDEECKDVVKLANIWTRISKHEHRDPFYYVMDIVHEISEIMRDVFNYHRRKYGDEFFGKMRDRCCRVLVSLLDYDKRLYQDGRYNEAVDEIKYNPDGVLRRIFNHRLGRLETFSGGFIDKNEMRRFIGSERHKIISVDEIIQILENERCYNMIPYVVPRYLEYFGFEHVHSKLKQSIKQMALMIESHGDHCLPKRIVECVKSIQKLMQIKNKYKSTVIPSGRAGTAARKQMRQNVSDTQAQIDSDYSALYDRCRRIHKESVLRYGDDTKIPNGSDIKRNDVKDSKADDNDEIDENKIIQTLIGDPNYGEDESENDE
jgi:hypothetical protein